MRIPNGMTRAPRETNVASWRREHDLITAGIGGSATRCGRDRGCAGGRGGYQGDAEEEMPSAEVWGHGSWFWLAISLVVPNAVVKEVGHLREME